MPPWQRMGTLLVQYKFNGSVKVYQFSKETMSHYYSCSWIPHPGPITSY